MLIALWVAIGVLIIGAVALFVLELFAPYLSGTPRS